MKNSIAIIGGGPAALLICKRLATSASADWLIDVFEASDSLGSGMPYSPLGANVEHVTNVSANELPDLLAPLDEWVKNLPESTLQQFGIRETNRTRKRRYLDCYSGNI